jgi:prepilin-type N-terminal cleavage/methylation domain-containing protein/prepilin-type processing-associated H-X9-DG protein
MPFADDLKGSLSMNRRNRHADRAFTLIELLVVIAIVSLLVSILLPSLKNAKRLARSVLCMNNMRQIGVWGMTWAGERRGVLPVNGHSTDLGYYHDEIPDDEWMPWYKKCEYWVSEGQPGTDDNHTQVVDKTGILQCPEAQIVLQPRYYRGNFGSVDYTLCNYLGGRRGQSGKIFPLPTSERLRSGSWWFADGKIGWDSRAPYQAYLGPDDAMNIYETNGGLPWMWGASVTAPYTFTNPKLRQFGHNAPARAHFLYGDGHVDPMDWGAFDDMSRAEQEVFNSWDQVK